MSGKVVSTEDTAIKVRVTRWKDNNWQTVKVHLQDERVFFILAVSNNFTIA
jgi:hypothetical protein